jgi:hypothetical protein
MHKRLTKSTSPTQRPNQVPASLSQKQTISIPKSEQLSATADHIKSIIRNTLLASPAFPRLYADVVLSSAPNSNEAKILAQNYKKICDSTTRTNMSFKNCTHIKVTGVRCGSPALRGEQFCYFHQRMLRTVQVPDSRVHHAALLEDEEAIQVSLMEVVNGLIRGTIELKRGELILRALNTAVRNIRRVKFYLYPEKMVREVPNEPAPPKPEPETPPAQAATASPAAAYMAAVAKSESCGDSLCGDGSKPVTSAVEGTRPGGPEVPGRRAVAVSPPFKSPAARQAGVEAPAIDPTRPKRSLGVKEVAAPKERKIAAAVGRSMN